MSFLFFDRILSDGRCSGNVSICGSKRGRKGRESASFSSSVMKEGGKGREGGTPLGRKMKLLLLYIDERRGKKVLPERVMEKSFSPNHGRELRGERPSSSHY